MAIRIPTSDQSKIFLGSQEIGAVYVGANKVWPDAPVIDPNAFIMRISVLANTPITIPFFNEGSYNGTINWKDGSTSTITSYNDADLTHTYTTGGVYDIEFTGSFPHLYFSNGGSKNIVLGIVQWGNVGMTSTVNSFWGCINMSTLGDFENYNYATIGSSSFYECSKLTSITIPTSVTTIQTYAFGNCIALTSITIPTSVTTIQTYAFSNCFALTSIVIPNSVTIVKQGICSGCSKLTNVVIPASVTSIESSVFENCTSMLTYTINPTTPPTLGPFAFTGATGWQIKVPAASVAAYKAAYRWKAYASRIVAI